MSIVLRLQKKCIDKDEDLQNLLREALVISKKLKLGDFEEWINCELKGYQGKEIPSYRQVQTDLKFWNPYQGWIPAIVQDKKIAKLFSQTNIGQPIGELENLSKNGSNNLEINLQQNQKASIMKFFDTNLKPRQSVANVQIYGIINQVRNMLLDWTLQLEEDGILGNDDLIFSEGEKKAAQNIHIESFNGVMGNVNKLGNLSTGANSTNVYNENTISSEIDKLIVEVQKLGLPDQNNVIRDLEASKENPEKAKTVLGSLLSRGAEVASISSAVISLLSLLN
ncbi:hypothetical protein [Sulfurovum sp.]|uniref:AbiTii domain-containing protein n=1 Tax=Sulfurovum sp. TaxID=1969726 RepID=UPI003567BA97